MHVAHGQPLSGPAGVIQSAFYGRWSFHGGTYGGAPPGVNQTVLALPTQRFEDPADRRGEQ